MATFQHDWWVSLIDTQLTSRGGTGIVVGLPGLDQAPSQLNTLRSWGGPQRALTIKSQLPKSGMNSWQSVSLYRPTYYNTDSRTLAPFTGLATKNYVLR